MQETPVNALMESDIITISPDDTLADAGRKMKEFYCGWLPVVANGRPEGIITDRDIVIRAVSEGRDPTVEKIRDYMTGAVQRCKSQDKLRTAVEEMREHGVSRLIVVDNDDRMCGLLSFGRILRNIDDEDELTSLIACIGGKSWYIPARDIVQPDTVSS